MTRGAFITQLEKRLADLFPSWEAKEQQITLAEICELENEISSICENAVHNIGCDDEVEA